MTDEQKHALIDLLNKKIQLEQDNADAINKEREYHREKIKQVNFYITIKKEIEKLKEDQSGNQ